MSAPEVPRYRLHTNVRRTLIEPGAVLEPGYDVVMAEDVAKAQAALQTQLGRVTFNDHLIGEVDSLKQQLATAHRRINDLEAREVDVVQLQQQLATAVEASNVTTEYYKQERDNHVRVVEAQALYHDLAKRLITRIMDADANCEPPTDVELRLAAIIHERDMLTQQLATAHQRINDLEAREVDVAMLQQQLATAKAAAWEAVCKQLTEDPCWPIDLLVWVKQRAQQAREDTHGAT